MKKLLTFAVVALAVVSMTSCKKDWTCTCTILGITASTTIPDSTKSDAEDACTALQAGGATCELD